MNAKGKLRGLTLLGLTTLFGSTGFSQNTTPPQFPSGLDPLRPYTTRVSDERSFSRKVTLVDDNNHAIFEYTELASGLMRQQEDGTWVEADPKIEIFENGAVARNARHQVVFAASSDDPQGVFDILMPDHKRLRGQCIGIAYTSSDGKSLFIAEMKDVGGVVAGDSEVIYSDCFSGIKGSLRYRNKIGSFHQDVILQSALPDPAALGLDPDKTTVEVWTQFLDAPEANLTALDARTKGGVAAKDAIIQFGEMRIGAGAAFPYDPRA